MAPAEFPPPGSAGDDRDLLRRFLDGVEGLLKDLVETGEDTQGTAVFIPALRAPMQAAWEDAPGRFDAVRRNLAVAPAGDLRRHGLTGAALAFKLAVLGHWADTYNRLGTPRWLRKLLEMIDILFESILAALHMDGALTELKDYIAGSLEDN